MHVSIPKNKTGIVTGAILRKNSIKLQSALVAINKFCGSPTIVHTPPKAVPTAPCITISLKKAFPWSNSFWVMVLFFRVSAKIL